MQGLSLSWLRQSSFKIQAHAQAQIPSPNWYFTQAQICMLWFWPSSSCNPMLFSSKAWCLELPAMFLFFFFSKVMFLNMNAFNVWKVLREGSTAYHGYRNLFQEQGPRPKQCLHVLKLNLQQWLFFLPQKTVYLKHHIIISLAYYLRIQI